MPVSLSPPFSSLKSPWSFSTLGGPPHWHGTLEQPPWPSGGGLPQRILFSSNILLCGLLICYGRSTAVIFCHGGHYGIFDQ